MKLTPLDIRKQEFGRRVRGVDEEEVKAFLQMIASQWEEVQDEQRRLEEKVRDLDNKLEHYKRVEEALQEALRTARENAKEALETARQKAQIIVQEAEANATHIKRDADDDRRKMKRQIARLSHRRDELVSRLRAFLMSEMEMLARFEGDDAVGYIKLMPAEERTPEVPEIAEEVEQEPIPLPEEAPVAETPLPTWARFEDDEEVEDEPAPASTAGSIHEPEGTAPEPHAAAPDEPVRDEPIDSPAPEAFEHSETGEEAAVNDAVAPSFPAPVGAHSNGSPDFEHEKSNEMQPPLEHDVQPVQDVGATEPDYAQAEVETHAEQNPDQMAPGQDGHNPGVSRWLSDHLFSAFKKGGQEPGEGGHRTRVAESDSPHAVDTFTEPDLSHDEWGHEPASSDEPHYGSPQASGEEEEESFTVSSEEVERIRRILKGLD